MAPDSTLVFSSPNIFASRSLLGTEVSQSFNLLLDAGPFMPVAMVSGCACVSATDSAPMITGPARFPGSAVAVPALSAEIERHECRPKTVFLKPLHFDGGRHRLLTLPSARRSETRDRKPAMQTRSCPQSAMT